MKRHKPKPTEEKPSAKQDNGHGEKESTKRHVYIEPGAKIDLVEDLKKEYESANTDTSTHNQKQLFWAKITTALIVITAGFTFWQGYLTRRIANTGEDGLHLQTRPWLGVSGTVAPRIPMTMVYGKFPDVRVDVPFSFLLSPKNTIKEGEGFLSYDGAFDLRNYGSTPAIHAAYSVSMAVDRNDAERASKGACDAANEAVASGHNSQESRQGIVLFPSAQEPEQFIAAAHANSIPSSVFLLGCVVYEDTTGKRHTTKFCQYGVPGNDRAVITCALQTYAD
jgi:hypothetical protein